MPPRLRALAWATLLASALATPTLLLLEPAPAHAQSARKKAQRIFQDGQARFQAGDFREAGVLFLQAFDLDPHPAILYNVARAFEEAGELPRALGYYRRALSLRPPDRIAEEVGAKLREIELYLRAQGVDVTDPNAAWAPRGTLTVRTDPDGAEVLLNNLERLGRTPLVDHPIPQGAYTVIVRKPGHQDLRREITVIAGRSYLIDQPLAAAEDPAANLPTGFLDVSAPRRNLMVFIDGEPRALTPVGSLEVPAGDHRITVEAVEQGDDFPTWEARLTVEAGKTHPVVASWPAPVIIPQEDTRLLSNTGWGWVAGGVGAASLLAGATFGALAWDSANDYQARRSDPARPTFRDDAETFALTADIFYGLGAAFVGAGALLILLDDGAPEDDRAYDALSTRLAPTLAPDGRGLGAAATLTW